MICLAHLDLKKKKLIIIILTTIIMGSFRLSLYGSSNVRTSSVLSYYEMSNEVFLSFSFEIVLIKNIHKLLAGTAYLSEI